MTKEVLLSMSKKLLLSLAAVATALSLAACGAENAEDGEGAGEAEGTAAEGAEAQMPEPDTENIPDVVATVNGQDISGEDFTAAFEGQFSQMAMQAQMSGEEVDQNQVKAQTLDLMIGNELLLADAEEQGFTASEEQVNEFLDELATQNQLESADELLSQFEEQGVSEEQVREDAEKQVLLDQLIESMDVEAPSDDELQEMYDQQIAQQEAMMEGAEEGASEGAEGGAEDEASAPETPSFEELKPQLEEQATTQKQNEAVNAHVEQLRGDAEIEKHLDTGDAEGSEDSE
ncbi:SurA N-terminal domain-containing protein [Micrococcaceae sp. AOP34-BR2-30]